ncbi:DUF1826 domain-containing protein [Roseomonas sp. USHLN139]|uniref:DUF1826 domain-containing protein n=1 Tax=Roseomonas sp. USHLN139 TaxID=3081298 RepID=UPI003B027C07
MSLFSEASWVSLPRRSVVAGRDSAVLGEFLRPEVGLLLWDRPLPAPLRRGAREMLQAGARLEAEGEPTALLDSLLAQAPLPQAWLAELGGLALLLAGFAGRPQLRARLEAPCPEPAPAFRDSGPGLTLLCTYRGPATQWLAPGPPEATGAEIRQAATGSVLLLRGAWKLRPPPSPALSASPGSPPRLLLRLETLP